MDSTEAQIFATRLIEGLPVANWKLTGLLGHGKSAVVMKGVRNGEVAAIKVFHPSLLERYSVEAQSIRINREKSLVGRSHENIVQIIDGGTCSSSGYMYVAMNYVSGQSLSSARDVIPRENILGLIEQLARAAKQLENWQIIHRDIKPGNLHINDRFDHLTLLDFGVMKPLGNSEATNLQPSKGFIGTHQYSPPEMIHGRELHGVDEWRAVTFYQIGAVMHDLICCKPLFMEAADRTLAELVNAIDHLEVTVFASDVPHSVCNLATSCLLKNPQDRTKLITWDDFFFSEKRAEPSNRQARISSLTRRVTLGELRRCDPLEKTETDRLRMQLVQSTARNVRSAFDRAIGELTAILPMRTVERTDKLHPEPILTCVFVADEKRGFVEPFHVQLGVQIIEGSRVVPLYGRAGRGIEISEIGWSNLGDVLGDFTDAEVLIQDWIVGVVEEILG